MVKLNPQHGAFFMLHEVEQSAHKSDQFLPKPKDLTPPINKKISPFDAVGEFFMEFAMQDSGPATRDLLNAAEETELSRRERLREQARQKTMSLGAKIVKPITIFSVNSIMRVWYKTPFSLFRQCQRA